MWCDTVDMCVHSNRVQSFRDSGWPHDFLSPETMAKCGFYYLKRGDEVRCAYCKVEIMSWVMSDDPLTDHKRYAPKCKFAQGAIVNSKTFNNNAEEQQNKCGHNTLLPKKPIHQQYINFTSRLQSFSKWSCVLSPEHLADAGFFYENTQNTTVCFWCDGRLNNWCSDDDAWNEHARWFPTCEYVAKINSEYYAEMMKSESCVIRRVDEVVEVMICKICFVRNCDVCFTPCGHVFVCGECALSLKSTKCPMCRADTSIMRLFFS
ncbi:MAG: iap-3 [Betabaculovirus sp.]|nr:MAG: iap-3 [Betabaculovirus sp.]